MTKVYFWEGLIGDKERYEPYIETIAKIARGDYQAADLDLKKLRGHRIYSARINHSDRLLFTTVWLGKKPYLLLLDVILNHDYQKCRFLKPAVLTNYLESHSSQFTGKILDEEFIRLNESIPLAQQNNEPLQYIGLEYYNQMYLELTDRQQTIRKASLPMVVSGPPGSGKSCVAWSLLIQAVKQKEQLSGPIVYVTQSETLKSNFAAMATESSLEEGRALFLTYREFLMQFDAEARKKQLVDESHFFQWLELYCKNFKAILKAKRITFDEKLLGDFVGIYQELRILAAYDAHDYLKLGEKQSLLADITQREWLLKLYQSYLAYLERNNALFPPFYQSSVNASCGILIVDEAQDFSHQQLKVLLHAADHEQICYCLGSHQSLKDSKSKLPFLLGLKSNYSEMSYFELDLTHRCPPVVVELANKIIQIKNNLTGGLADKREFVSFSATSQEKEEGSIQWLATNSENEMESLRQAAQSTKFAVVTSELYVNEAKKLFNTPLVFTANEIKGLEYDSVVAYRLLETEEFYRANAYLARMGHLSNPVHRPKHAKGDESFGPPFNQLFTCFTRTRKNLFIIQNASHKLEKLISLIQQAIQQKPGADIQIVESKSENDWEREAQRLEQMGKMQQANDIRQEKLGKTAKAEQSNSLYGSYENLAVNAQNESSERTRKKKESGSKKPDAESKNLNHSNPESKLDRYRKSLLQNATEKNLLNLFVHPQAERILFDDYAESCLFKQLISIPWRMDNLANVIRDNRHRMALIARNFGKINANSTIIPWEIIVLKLLTLVPNFAFELPVDYLRGTVDGVSRLFLFSKTTIGCQILKALIVEHPEDSVKSGMTIEHSPLIEELSIQDLIQKNNEVEAHSALIQLASSDTGLLILKALFSKNKRLLLNLQLEDLLQISYPSVEGIRGSNALYWLCLRGQDLLLFILQNNLQLAKTIRFKHLLLNVLNSASEYSPPPLKFLNYSDKGRQIIQWLQQQNPELGHKLAESKKKLSDYISPTGLKPFNPEQDQTRLTYLDETELHPQEVRILTPECNAKSNIEQLLIDIMILDDEQKIDSSKCTSINEKNLMDLFKHPMAEKFLFEPVINDSCVFLKLLQTAKSMDILARVAHSNINYLKMIAINLEKHLPREGGSLFFKLHRMNLLLNFLRHFEQIPFILSIHVLREIPYVNEGDTVFLLLSKTLTGQQILSRMWLGCEHHLANNQNIMEIKENILDITWKDVTKVNNEQENDCAWINLIASPVGIRVFYSMCHFNDWLKELTNYDLLRVTSSSINGLKGTTPLYWLCSSEVGRKLLSDLLQTRPELAQTISFQQLMRPANNKEISAWDELISTEEGGLILKKLQSLNQSFAKDMQHYISLLYIAKTRPSREPSNLNVQHLPASNNQNQVDQGETERFFKLPSTSDSSRPQRQENKFGL
ncbi:hypothetical protein [Legionella jordanis]|uniref:Viral (Superfamily 1) RNA helicase n=1 Tax=Legionella jordanis TaxID=456 RepID=A0A0W0V9E1_9GAMM|nr:hypothetical protein [Legionella jordanis]KTD16763.1 Viral (Superfamily 1) RNA helicase [Legionella jordanis]RMX03709.1 hypothetical protein EAW55_04900 [Legionella jordanis]RMX22229.1 hypothetical protein EAS68_01525 [Legionella jordanis]VEH11769.1 Viral (Superfamily 1) RNA helicase [Legionella jordanis]